MNNTEFENIFDRRVAMCREVMVTKAKEYAAAHDRLANFKKAGALQYEHPAKALQGMMAKHQVSIADMTAGLDVGTTYSQAQWDEKIGDALNYLFLLDAVVQELAAPIRVSQADLDLLEERLKAKVETARPTPAGPAVYGPASFLTSTDELFRSKTVGGHPSKAVTWFPPIGDFDACGIWHYNHRLDAPHESQLEYMVRTGQLCSQCNHMPAQCICAKTEGTSL